MQFRFYQLFFVASMALLIAAMCMPVMQFTEPDGATVVLGNFSLTQLHDGALLSHAVCALGVVLIFTALVNAFGLFISLFKNFELQKRASILGMLLITGYYILLFVTMWVLGGDAECQMLAATIFPFTALMLNALCFLSARRTEAKILAKAAGFRLRD